MTLPEVFWTVMGRLLVAGVAIGVALTALGGTLIWLAVR